MKTTRERILDIFNGKVVENVVWQPRIYYWYYGNGLRNSPPEEYGDRSMIDFFEKHVENYHGKVPKVPPEYRDKSMIEIYRDLNASPRYPHEVLGVQLFKSTIGISGPEENDKVKIDTSYDLVSGETTSIFKTKVGNLREVRSGYIKEFLVKDIHDIEILEYIIENANFSFDPEAFEIADKEFGDLGVVQSFFIRSPFQSLIVEFMGFEKTIILLHRHREKIEELLEHLDGWHDRVYETVLDTPVQILNFADNIDLNLDSPPIFEKYLLPYYQKRIEQIHKAGKYCHLHVDGSFKDLIPLLKRTNFDGLEALTAKPQGDVSLDEMKEAIGDKVLIDGIPAILFTDEYSYSYLEEFVKKVLEEFPSGLILGVSDELPPTADIKKVEFVSDIVQDW